MASKKPKPATAGKKMLLITVAGHKRAIARAVRKERTRCAYCLAYYINGVDAMNAINRGDNP